jgi:hypothetical protein
LFLLLPVWNKFPQSLTNWEQYLSPTIVRFTSGQSIYVHARCWCLSRSLPDSCVLAGFTTLRGVHVSAWLTLIALSLIQSGHYIDVAGRDLVMAVGFTRLAF